MAAVTTPRAYSPTPHAHTNVARARHASDPTLSRRQLRTYWLLAALWLAANLCFWAIWLQPRYVGSLWLHIPFTLAIAYQWTFLPTTYLFFPGRMRRPRPVPAPVGRKVALIATCVPANESLDVIVDQMRALQNVHYPHDSWVLDEGNDPAVREAAARLGVHYFTRVGIARYNQPTHPFQAKTKAGNVNAWLDLHGDDYEFFVQFDIDHRPEPDYLEHVLGYFEDPTIAWIQAPSVYGNLTNWYARGAAEQELVLQGPLQQGFYGTSSTPFIIGSHCTYRMSAIREIGGFQPTRAEDHLDTVVLATQGYRGVFVPNVIATGGGPETFEVYLRQQFAWAYSLVQVLFRYAPYYVTRVRLSQTLEFLFAQTWYPLWSTTMLFLFLVPDIVLFTDQRPSTIGLPLFVLSTLPTGICEFAIWWWSRHWHVPTGLRLSWRGIILHVARWPTIFWAFLNVLLGIKHPYMITPKGVRDGLGPFSLRSQLPYLVLAWTNIASVWVYVARHGAPESQGYILFAALGAFWMLAVVIVNLAGSIVALQQGGVARRAALHARGAPLATLAASGILLLSLGIAPKVQAAYPASPAKVASSFHIAVTPAAEPPIIARVPAVLPTAAATPAPAMPMALPIGRVAIGAYDPGGQLASLPLDIRQTYLSENQPTLLRQALDAARNRWTPLVTIQPTANGAHSVLREIVDGRRDAELRQLATIIRSHQPQIVYVRWAQEMDLRGLYPWSEGNPALYRAAYRHVVALFNAEGVTNVRWVWSPSGNAGSLAYYPGSDVVDDVGITVLDDPHWDAMFGYSPRSFGKLMVEKYPSIASLGKPIIIAELGVSGSAQRQATWLEEAAKALPHFPLVQAVIYFDAPNAPDNHLPVEPNWTTTPSTLRQFLDGVRMDRLAALLPMG